VANASGRMPDGIVMNTTTYSASVAVKAAGYLVPPVPYPSPVFPGTTLRLALNPAMADGQALVGSYAFGGKLDVKGGFRVDVADSFLKNQSVIRTEMRCFLAITRLLSFAKITGLPPVTTP
jgi:hypothetical protein